MVNESRLIVVGGFLGAGKTTLLDAVAKSLLQRGKRVGLITNDQAPQLVDTALLQQQHGTVAEVSGSCFCCNYEGFVEAIGKVQTHSQAQIILAEPVGSCTDLAATIMQPIIQQYGKAIRVSPLTVLADPIKLSSILQGGNAWLHPSAAYIYRKQLEESDIILVTKTDLFTSGQVDSLLEETARQFPKQVIMCVSAKTGAGIDDWLNLVLTQENAGQNIIEIDYDTYAEGEAVLGWLNASVKLAGDKVNWKAIASQLLHRIQVKLNTASSSIGHCKIFLETADGYLKGNLVHQNDQVTIHGDAGAGNLAHLLINARVELDPQALEGLVKESLDESTGQLHSVEISSWQCFRPGYPTPTHRFPKLV